VEGWRSRGSVTAETALALPAVLVVLAALLGTGRVVLAQLGCVDAARAGARAAARADPDARIQDTVLQLAPGSIVKVRRSGGVIRVEVSNVVRVPMPMPPVRLTCAAVSEAEGTAANDEVGAVVSGGKVP
jgi:Flp pilus assembly protein TadG